MSAETQVNDKGEVVVDLQIALGERRYHSTVPASYLLEQIAVALEKNTTQIFIMLSESDDVRGYWVNAQDARAIFRIAPVYDQAPLPMK